MLMQEERESSERDWQTFLFDQTTSLDEPPFLYCRNEVSFTKRKFIQRNSGPLDLNFLFVAAQIDDCAPQRLRANKHQLHRIEHLPGRLSISRLVHVDDHIGPVKRNNRRFVPRA